MSDLHLFSETAEKLFAQYKPMYCSKALTHDNINKGKKLKITFAIGRSKAFEYIYGLAITKQHFMTV